MTSDTTYRMCTRHVVPSRRNINKLNCLPPVRVPLRALVQGVLLCSLLTTWLCQPVDVVASLGTHMALVSSRHRPPPTATGQRPEGRCGESHRVARNGDAEGSPGAATCLRIGLEPTGSASGDAVSPTPVPTASA